MVNSPTGVHHPAPPCLVIAEAGVNHNGRLDLALRLVDAAADAGADIVKFQTFKAERLVTLHARKAAYQEEQTGTGDQFSMLEALELSDEAHYKLLAHCRSRGIEFCSTAFDELSLCFLVELGIRRIKIPSGELTNAPFIRAMASYGLPMIVSTGMATLNEIEDALGWIEGERRNIGAIAPLSDLITLLHCTSNYPTPIHDVNLRAMQTLAERFCLPVGYSDHTAGIFIAPIARALGATVFEKHFTLDRSLPGPDHVASLEPDELALMVRAIRDTDIVLGSAEKVPSTPEWDVRIAARRSVTLARDVFADVPLTRADLVLMRPGNGIAPSEIDLVIGRRLKRNMCEGDTLSWKDLVECVG